MNFKRNGSITFALLFLVTVTFTLTIQLYNSTKTLSKTSKNTKEFLTSISTVDTMKIGLRDYLRTKLKEQGKSKLKDNFEYYSHSYIVNNSGMYMSTTLVSADKYKVVFNPSVRIKDSVVVYYKIETVDGLLTVNIINK